MINYINYNISLFSCWLSMKSGSLYLFIIPVCLINMVSIRSLVCKWICFILIQFYVHDIYFKIIFEYKILYFYILYMFISIITKNIHFIKKEQNKNKEEQLFKKIHCTLSLQNVDFFLVLISWFFEKLCFFS